MISGCNLREIAFSLRDEAQAWCRGRNWLVRLPLLPVVGYIFIRNLTNPGYCTLFSLLNIGIHELGHILFSPFGEFIHTLGGTLLEVAAPFLAMINFYRQKDFFAIILMFGWLADVLFDVARYVGDARSMELPLLTLFGSETTIHDWNYLLGHFGLLEYDTVIAFLIKCVAGLSILICFGGGIWLLQQMKKGCGRAKLRE